ncbi:MAG: small multidrug resistance protein [Paenibacillus sp.]|jgi:quaternary ammonium compound-resistance protein SugE|nr:small multidrug resistance protein [Paenibacillus sp.]
MAWVFLVIAGLFEVVWAVGLKYTHGFTRLWPSIITLGGMFVSFFFLSLSLKTLPLGTGYAIWTGIGAVGTVILGMVMFGESRELIRIMFVFLIVTGIVGLKVTAGH